MNRFSQAESWRDEIITLVGDIDDPYWLQYILQMVHLIWIGSSEIYPEVEEDDNE